MRNRQQGDRLLNGSFRRATVCASTVGLLMTCAVAADSVSNSRQAKRSVAIPGAQTHPLVPALRWAQSSLQSVSKLNDYEATFRKKELVGGRVIPARMHIKYRAKPISAYLRFYDQHDGREVIYVKGKNGGKLLVHETGVAALLGIIALVPTSPQAMAEGRHPITEIGMQKMLEGVIKQWKDETRYGEIDVTYFHKAKLGKRPCTVIQTSHPTPRKQFKFHLTRLYIDKETNLPVRVEQHGFPIRAGEKPPLVEEYTYSNLKTDVGLKDIDFDTRNPKYNF